MLRSLHDLRKYTLSATDGNIGSVTDFYFDDESWVVRYLVVDTDPWLMGRTVLISPISIGRPDFMERDLPVTLSKDQIRQSPDVNAHRPVSRQMESGYAGYYGYQSYWTGAGLWWGGIYPNAGYGYGGGESGWLPLEQRRQMSSGYLRDLADHHARDDVHLRSSNAVTGYHILATDGELGHVDGFLIDEDTWAIRFFIVNTSNWWVGQQVLVAPEWIERISWSDSVVTLAISRDTVRSAPPYKAGQVIERTQEPALFAHYGRTGFWKPGESRVRA